MRLGLILPAETVQVGGVQRFGAELCAALQQLAQVETTCLHPPRGAARTLLTRLRGVGTGVARLYAAHRRERLDAVLSTFHGPCKLIPGVPMAGFVHDLRLWGLETPEGFHANRWRPIPLALAAAFRTWDVIFVPSPHVAEDVERLVPGKRTVIAGEGLDHLDRFRRRGQGVSRNGIVVFAGQMAHKRGDLGLDVAERLARELGCSATVLGTVSRRPQARDVVVRPDITDSELAALLAESRLAVAPTSYEGFGLAAGEAMRFGVPVVYASDCPIGHLVGDGGLAASPTADGFVTTACRLWDAAGEYGMRAAERAAPRTWRGTAQRILDELAEGPSAIARRRLDVERSRGAPAPKGGPTDWKP